LLGIEISLEAGDPALEPPDARVESRQTPRVGADYARQRGDLALAGADLPLKLANADGAGAAWIKAAVMDFPRALSMPSS
jgi:hypothetical protein